MTPCSRVCGAGWEGGGRKRGGAGYIEGPSIVLVSEGRREVVWDGDKGRIEIGRGMWSSLVQGRRL